MHAGSSYKSGEDAAEASPTEARGDKQRRQPQRRGEWRLVRGGKQQQPVVAAPALSLEHEIWTTRCSSQSP